MWLLVMTLLIPVPGIQAHQVLEEYETHAKCQIARDYVGFNMAEAYPQAAGEFIIECIAEERQVKQNYPSVNVQLG